MKKIHTKLQNNIELTKDEVSLNNRLIREYPEYTRVLNDKTGAIGINIEALKTNFTAQEALATIEFNSMIETAKMRKLEVEDVINKTEAKVKAIESEILAIEARNKAYASSINADDPNALQYEKILYTKCRENACCQWIDG